MSQRWKLVVAYLGEPLHGWQRQRGQATVQGELERALGRLVGRPAPAIVGAGRTDAGVHARCQVAHFDLAATIPEQAVVDGLNRLLPRGVRVRSACRVASSFHARRSARGKHYAYRVRWQISHLPWRDERVAVIGSAVDLTAVRSALAPLAGRHDFASFTVSDPSQGTTERELFSVSATARAHGLDLHFVGDGFLRYQVRRMVGMALDVGRGRRSSAEVCDLLSTPHAGAPVRTAPARGLTLERVYYRQPRLPR